MKHLRTDLAEKKGARAFRFGIFSFRAQLNRLRSSQCRCVEEKRDRAEVGTIYDLGPAEAAVTCCLIELLASREASQAHQGWKRSLSTAREPL